MPDISALDMVTSRAAGQPALSVSGRSGDLPVPTSEPEPAPEPKPTAAPAVEAGTGRPADFDEIVFNPNLPVTQDMAAAIANEPDPDAVAYYLGQHPDEAARIAALAPIAQVTAIGRVAHKAEISKPKPSSPTPRRAADPPQAAPRPLAELSMDEYAARHAERQARPPDGEMEAYARKRNGELQWTAPVFGRVR